jgi:uncharacterized protein
MTTQKNKEIVRNVNKGFEAADADIILSYLTDDIRWEVPGAFTVTGKEEYRKQIFNDAFEKGPVITIKNEIAEGNYVAVEGRVENKMKNGHIFKAVFHNTYYLENEKIKAMTS